MIFLNISNYSTKTLIMQKFISFLSLFIMVFTMQSCLQKKQPTEAITQISEIDLLISDWHEAAAEANFENYFEMMDEDFVFVGTDASEHWNKAAFATYSKPHFDKGKAWKFITLKRNIYHDSTSNYAWFDEILDTSFKICRGSGVLKRDSLGVWKFKQYVLSMTVPNEKAKEVVQLKDSLETKMIENLKK